MPLWNVNLPANAVLFYGFIMQIASFDILPTDLFWNYCFPGINPDGLNAVNPNFASVGYYSYYLIYNFGSMMITYVAFPFLAIIVAIMQPFVGRNKKVAYVHKKIKESIMWGGTITTITESYTVGLTCICVNTLYVSSLLFNFLVHLGNCWRDFKLNSNTTLWSHKLGVPTDYDLVCLQELVQNGRALIQTVLWGVLRSIRYRQRKGHLICIFTFLF